jgi:hypothetical protein
MTTYMDEVIVAAGGGTPIGLPMHWSPCPKAISASRVIRRTPLRR